MRKVILVAPFVLLAPLVSVVGQTTDESPKTFDLQAIDGYISRYVKQKGLVGLSVAIMRDGEMVFAKGYGLRQLENSLPMETNTSFAVGSITKQFTCACILLLAEEGKLSVHDPVGKYFPHLTRATEITLLDLMNHTSGYPDYYPLDFVDRRLSRPITFDGLLTDYAAARLDFEPGSRFSYSNTGYIILGGVVEKASGEKFGDFLQQRILTPLKMKDSRFATAQGLSSPATGYNGFALGPPEPAIPEGDGWIEAAGGLWASAADLLRWDLALVSGQVLKSSSYELMTRPRKLATGRISNYGCGLRTDIQQGDIVLQHTGGVSGFVSFNGVHPRTKSGLVVLSNTEHISATPLRAELFHLLLQDIAQKEAPSVPLVDGPEPKQVVLDLLHQMQSGKVDRSLLSDEFSFFLSEGRIAAAAQRLKDLGEPENVESDPPSERGGMQVMNVKLTFKTAKLRASLYRLPNGKIEQLLFYGE
jgi:CubicO group peptidase (beta-lactamase class C family)